MQRNILPRVRHPEPLRLLTEDCTANVSPRLASPIIRLLDGLLSGQECDDLIALAVPRLQRHFFDALRDSLKKNPSQPFQPALRPVSKGAIG
ncbi:hypothetical protein [Dyella nitratireducens]|uniref:hypothetical protein n=1 Tax=Dyella nitratireducens TaxID=1849580 RepID=UPI001666F751|nr:hypothetical protein [Dyella nitratireducens]